MTLNDDALRELIKELNDYELVFAKCEICGNQSPIYIQKHHIVPQKYSKISGVSWSETTPICCNCHIEIHHILKSYSTKILGAPTNEEKLQICKVAIEQLKNRKKLAGSKGGQK